MKTIEQNGLRLAYDEKGAGPALVLVHGTGFTSRAWFRVTDGLAGQFRVITYDRRGYGGSRGAAAGTKTYNQTQASDLLLLLEKLDLREVTLLGWSAGALHCYHAVLQDPSRIRQLVCYEPPLHAAKNIDGHLFRHFMKMNLQKAFGNRKGAVSTFVRMVTLLQGGGSSLDRFRADCEKVLSPDYKLTLDEIAAGTGEELKPEMLKHIKVPVTFLSGDRSVGFFQKATRRQLDIFGGQDHILAGCGHFAHLENPDQFVDTLAKAVKNTFLTTAG
ncbi:MAG TPA: alpha/beta hydrolase [Flavilitoribacter sp.]|nr:alpha/beta hydrolase [Flavilitoribacter sp.]HMQ86728.1 alpha/beta hydrolase [Flavilitoribacter sp.]